MADRDAQEHTHGRVPFWAHQLAEILLGVVLLFEGARNDSHVAVILTGALLLVFSLVSDGPVSAWPLLGRRVHRVGDFVVAAVLAVSPLLLGITDVVAIVLLEGAALALVWLGLRTDFTAPRRRARTKPPVRARVAPKAAPAPTPPSARSAGRALGRMRATGPRAVGRAMGRARAERAAEQAPRGPSGTGPDGAKPTSAPEGDEQSPE
jgi:uncharacterized membrane protein YhaH (DUF805 family)